MEENIDQQLKEEEAEEEKEEEEMEQDELEIEKLDEQLQELLKIKKRKEKARDKRLQMENDVDQLKEEARKREEEMKQHELKIKECELLWEYMTQQQMRLGEIEHNVKENKQRMENDVDQLKEEGRKREEEMKQHELKIKECEFLREYVSQQQMRLDEIEQNAKENRQRMENDVDQLKEEGRKREEEMKQHELKTKELKEQLRKLLKEKKREEMKTKVRTITFKDAIGQECVQECTGTNFEVPVVKIDSVERIDVDTGTWITYTDTYFKGGAHRLTSGGDTYKDSGKIKRMAQTLTVGQEWTGDVGSIRLVTPGIMLFDRDNFRGTCLVSTETTDSFEYFDCRSMIIESEGYASKHAQVDVVFVLDGSASINNQHTGNFDKVKQFAVKMLSDLDIGPTATRVGAVQYSKTVISEFKLADHTDRDSVERAFNNVKYQDGDGTKTGSALEFVHTQMDWREAPAKRVVIVVTDGQSHDDVDTPSWALRQDDFLVYAVGVGPTPNNLVQMTNDHGKVTSLYNFDRLEEQMELLSAVVSQAAEWVIYQRGGFHGKEWNAYPGYYTSADLEKNIGGKVGSAKRHE
ncbi:uncharacterized protein [Branchiostoma lanceolatum]|uniref:uncharacterized protein n=1 Tax=Branchiostoma lanceolatum TaxID=7740 RepID=UPI003451FEF3